MRDADCDSKARHGSDGGADQPSASYKNNYSFSATITRPVAATAELTCFIDNAALHLGNIGLAGRCRRDFGHFPLQRDGLVGENRLVEAQREIQPHDIGALEKYVAGNAIKCAAICVPLTISFL